MADEIEVTVPPVAEPAASPAASAPAIDPAEYAAMQSELGQWRAFNEQAAPYAERIQRLITDEEFRNFNDQSYSAYEKMREDAKPVDETPAWFKPYADRINEETSQKSRAEAEQNTKWQRDEMDFAARLVAEQPQLRTGNGIVRIAAFADAMAKVENRRVGIEEAYKVMLGFQPGASAPAPSLRADSGSVGIPDKAPTNNEAYKKDFYGTALATLKRAKSAG